jgi:hypothetical protein
MLGADFPLSTFLPHKKARIIQVDYDRLDGVVEVAADNVGLR